MEKFLYSYCSSCRQKTKHHTLFTKKNSSEPEADFGWSEHFQVVECAGCTTVSFRKEYTDESMFSYDNEGHEFSYEDVITFPLHLQKHIPLPSLYSLPPRIRTVYQETIESFKVKSYLLTAAGFRTIIEALCIEEEITGRNLEVKIRNMAKAKLISEREEKRLHSIRFLGNDSLHEISVPKPQKLYTVLEIIEHLLRNLYIIDEGSMQELDTIIDTFESLERVLWARTRKVDLEDQSERTLKQILGKDVRRVGDALPAMEQRLVESISNGAINFLALGKVALGPPPVQYYTIPFTQNDF